MKFEKEFPSKSSKVEFRSKDTFDSKLHSPSKTFRDQESKALNDSSKLPELSQLFRSKPSGDRKPSKTPQENSKIAISNASDQPSPKNQKNAIRKRERFSSSQESFYNNEFIIFPEGMFESKD